MLSETSFAIIGSHLSNINTDRSTFILLSPNAACCISAFWFFELILLQVCVFSTPYISEETSY